MGLIVAKIESIEGDTLNVEIVASVSQTGALGTPRPYHGYTTGQRLPLSKQSILAVIKPEPPQVLKIKNRRKRHKVGPGELIELRPQKPLPPDTNWSPNREDVQVNIVEQHDDHAVVTLDGPRGEVSVALLSAVGKPEPRPVCSWKFRLVEGGA